MLFKWKRKPTKLEKMMSDLSDAVAALTANLAKLQTDMNKAFADLEAAVAAAGGDSADVAAAVAALGTVNASLQSMDTAALAADPVQATPSA